MKYLGKLVLELNIKRPHSRLEMCMWISGKEVRAGGLGLTVPMVSQANEKT